MTSANRKPVEESLIPFAPRTLPLSTFGATSPSVLQIKQKSQQQEAINKPVDLHNSFPLTCLFVHIEKKVMHDLIEWGPFFQPV